MKKTYLIISALLVMCTLASCAFFDSTCDFFTNSWGTNLKRDLSDNFSKMKSDQLAALINTPSVMNDKEASKKLLDELGKRDDITSLSAEDKNTVLNLMVNSSISAESLSSIINEVSNAGSGSDPKQLIDNILSNVDSCDVGAAVEILNDVDNLGNLSGSSASLAMVCVVAQVAKSSELTENLDKVMEDVDKVIKGEKTTDKALDDLEIKKDEDRDALKAAFNAAVKLKELNAEIFPGMTIGSLFS